MDLNSYKKYHEPGKINRSSQVDFSEEEWERSILCNPLNSYNLINSIKKTDPSHLPKYSRNFRIKSASRCKSQSHTIKKFSCSNIKDRESKQVINSVPNINRTQIKEFSRMLGRDENLTLETLIHTHSFNNLKPTFHSSLNQKGSKSIAKQSSKLKANSEYKNINICIFPTVSLNKSHTAQKRKCNEKTVEHKKYTFNVDGEISQPSTFTRLGSGNANKTKKNLPPVTYKINSRPKSSKKSLTSPSNVSQKHSLELRVWQCASHARERKLSANPSTSSCDDLHLPTDLTIKPSSQPTVELGVHSLLAHVLYPEIDGSANTSADIQKENAKVEKLDPRCFYVSESETDGSEDFIKMAEVCSQEVIQKTKNLVKMSTTMFTEMKNNLVDYFPSAEMSAFDSNKENEYNTKNEDNENNKNKEFKEQFENREKYLPNNPSNSFHFWSYFKDKMSSLTSKIDFQKYLENVNKPCETGQNTESTSAVPERNKLGNRVGFNLSANTKYTPQPTIAHDTEQTHDSKPKGKEVKKVASKDNPDIGQPKFVAKPYYRIASSNARRSRNRKKRLPSPVIKNVQSKSVLDSMYKILVQLRELDTLQKRIDCKEGDLRGELASLVNSFEDSCSQYNVVLAEFGRKFNISSSMVPPHGHIKPLTPPFLSQGLGRRRRRSTNKRRP